LADVGVALRDQDSLLALTEYVARTSEIEGAVLNVASVRSSIARRLSLSAQIQRERKDYCDVLERTQKGHA
jgi:Fic family protein